jgi:Circadian oscillating protein COP23
MPGIFLGMTSVRAAEQKFFCGQSSGVPTTMAMTSRGAVPVIRWVSSLGDGQYSPEARCQAVSERFQQYHEAGHLNYLTTGMENGHAVICVTDSQGGDCAGTLFTLKPGSNPDQTLQHLFGARDRVGPLNEGVPRVYVAMEEVLKGGAVAGEELPRSQEMESPPVPSDWGTETPPEPHVNDGEW